MASWRSHGQTLLSEKAQVMGCEVADIGHHQPQIRIWDSKPFGQRGSILIHRGSGQQATLANVYTRGWIEIGLRRIHRRAAVQILALDGIANNEVRSAPAMVGAIAIGHHTAAKVRSGEGRDALAQAQIFHGFVEADQGIVDFFQQWRVLFQQIIVVVKPPNDTKNT